ncbi:MAG: hypothetical protein LBR11_08660 [Deltaproteobacteria bacterium]|nr:hypothetical protein [Deltaproteobacteria bacterium]
MPLKSYFIIPSTYFFATSITGIFYSYILHHTDEIGIFFNFLLIIPWFCLVGKCGQQAIFRTLARAPKKVGILAILGAIPGYYVHFAFWISLRLNNGQVNFDLFYSLIYNIDFFISSLEKVNNIGKITLPIGLGFNDMTDLDGPLLAFFWIVELAIFFIFTYLISRSYANEPFSEEENTWYQEIKFSNGRFILPLSNLKLQIIADGINNNDLTCFLDLPLVDKNKNYVDCIKLFLFYNENANYCYVTIVLVQYYDSRSILFRKQETEFLASYLRIPSSQGRSLISKMSD